MRRHLAIAGLAAGLAWGTASQAAVISNILEGALATSDNYDYLGMFGQPEFPGDLNGMSFTLRFEYELPPTYVIGPMYGAHQYDFVDQLLSISFTVNGSTRTVSDGDRRLIASDGALELSAGRVGQPGGRAFIVTLFGIQDYRTLVGQPFTAATMPHVMWFDVESGFGLRGSITGLGTIDSSQVAKAASTVPAPNAMPLFAVGAASVIAACVRRRRSGASGV